MDTSRKKTKPDFFGEGRVQGRDRFSKSKRRAIMARIRSEGTLPETRVTKILSGAGVRFVSHPPVVGRPDFLVEGKVAVFCDGDFWHGRNWRELRAKLEAGSNAHYWVSHIERNRARDRKVSMELRRRGYSVVRLWASDVARSPAKSFVKIAAAMEALEPVKSSAR